MIKSCNLILLHVSVPIFPAPLIDKTILTLLHIVSFVLLIDHRYVSISGFSILFH